MSHPMPGGEYGRECASCGEMCRDEDIDMDTGCCKDCMRDQDQTN